MIPLVGRVSRPKAASENAPLLYAVQERVRAWFSKGELLPMCDPSSLVGPTQGGRGLRAAVLVLDPALTVSLCSWEQRKEGAAQFCYG